MKINKYFEEIERLIKEKGGMYNNVSSLIDPKNDNCIIEPLMKFSHGTCNPKIIAQDIERTYWNLYG